MTRFRLIAVDFLLMTLAFLLVNQAKRGALVLPEGYGVLLGLFYLAWGVSGVVGQEICAGGVYRLRAGVGTLVKTAVYLAFTIVFVVVMFGLQRYSRVQVLRRAGRCWGWSWWCGVRPCGSARGVSRSGTGGKMIWTKPCPRAGPGFRSSLP